MTYSGDHDDVAGGSTIDNPEGDLLTPNSKAFKARIRSASVAEKRQNELVEKKERGVIVLGCGYLPVGCFFVWEHQKNKKSRLEINES